MSEFSCPSVKRRRHMGLAVAFDATALALFDMRRRNCVCVENHVNELGVIWQNAEQAVVARWGALHALASSIDSIAEDALLI